MLLRCTDAWDGSGTLQGAKKPKRAACFVQKHMGRGLVAGIEKGEVDGEEVIYVTRAEEIVGLAQLNVIQTHDATDRISAISVPTLVLAGEEDILIPVRLSRRLAASVPGSSWTTVPGGHACLWESPDPFNTAFIDFVRSVSA